MNVPTKHWMPALLALLISGLTACGGGSGASDSGGTTSGDEVSDKLAKLGVSVQQTPRLDDNSEALPDDYSPFGSAQSFDSIEEITLLGPKFNNSTSELTLYELQSQNDRPIYAREDFFKPATSETPWSSSIGNAPANQRVVAAADIDGDGLDEIVVLYRQDGSSSITLQTYQESFNGGVIGFAPDQTLVVSTDPANNLSLLAGDFNGDGLAEFVLGMTFDSSARLLFINNSNGILDLDSTTRTLPQAYAGSTIQLSMASGNLDYDAGNEFVVVVNELFQSAGHDAGTARYFIFDDANQGYQAVSDNLIRAQLNAVNRTAIVADVATGDIDGDNVDEIIFGGLQNFDPNANCGYRYLMVALDDNKRLNVPIGGLDLLPDIYGKCSSSSPGELRYVHVNTLDLDGDGLPEIQANQYIFDDFVHADPWTQYAWTLDSNDQPVYAVIDDASLFANASGFTGRFAQDNSSMMTGDVTADGRQNIVFYSQATNKLQTWGLSNPDSGAAPLSAPIFNKDWRMMDEQTIQPPGSEPMHPQILASNINHDSLALRFSEGEHRLIFTEPILIAALAAAPCDTSLGQNADACRTSYGTASSNTVSQEDVLTVRASASVGFEAEFSALGVKVSGVEVLATLQAHASLIKSKAYTVTKRIVYTTGPIEDTVIFTTIPLDQYTYTITSHPDPDLIGSKVVISLPREPIEVQVERSRYNANVVTGGPQIDSSVFTHTPGKPSSYPNKSDKDSLLSSYSGLELGPQSVGNSGGNSSLSINVATESGLGVGYGVDYDVSVKGTIGTVVAGFSVGYSADKSLQIIHGNESEYTGAVSDMDLPTSDYGLKRYSWGLFTYLYPDSKSGQEFEVINYWVEP
jgi:hypothetical protein